MKDEHSLDDYHGTDRFQERLDRTRRIIRKTGDGIYDLVSEYHSTIGDKVIDRFKEFGLRPSDEQELLIRIICNEVERYYDKH